MKPALSRSDSEATDLHMLSNDIHEAPAVHMESPPDLEESEDSDIGMGI